MHHAQRKSQRQVESAQGSNAGNKFSSWLFVSKATMRHCPLHQYSDGKQYLLAGDKNERSTVATCKFQPGKSTSFK